MLIIALFHCHTFYHNITITQHNSCSCRILHFIAVRTEVKTSSEHKHLGMILDHKLDFQSHIREVILKARRGIGLIKHLSKYVSREVLDQVYKLYIRPHLDYGDIIYHRFDPEMHLEFTKKLEQVQYSAALAVTGTWRGTSRQRLYEELG